MASVVAMGVGWALARFVFDFTWTAAPWVPLAGALAGAVLALAAGWGAHIVYKGADSVIAAPDGQAVIADRRCAWLSVAGTGDVLAGCIAARLAHHGRPFAALAEAVWLHDRAARIAGPAFSALELAGDAPKRRASSTSTR